MKNCFRSGRDREKSGIELSRLRGQSASDQPSVEDPFEYILNRLQLNEKILKDKGISTLLARILFYQERDTVARLLRIWRKANLLNTVYNFLVLPQSERRGTELAQTRRYSSSRSLPIASSEMIKRIATGHEFLSALFWGMQILCLTSVLSYSLNNIYTPAFVDRSKNFFLDLANPILQWINLIVEDSVLGNTGRYLLFTAFFSLPVGLALISASHRYRNWPKLTVMSAIENIQRTIAEDENPLWQDCLFYFLPFSTLREQFAQLSYLSNWSKEIDENLLEENFRLYQYMIKERRLLVPILALKGLAELADSMSWQEAERFYVELNDTQAVSRLQVRLLAITEIEKITSGRFRGEMQSIVEHQIYKAYAYYLLFLLGSTTHPWSQRIFYLVKFFILSIQCILLGKLFYQCIQFLICPNQPGFSVINYAPANQYLKPDGCYVDEVALYGMFPGEPIAVIASQAILKGYDLRYLNRISFKDKGMDRQKISDYFSNITQYNIDQPYGYRIILRSVDLQGNALNAPEDITTVLASLPSTVVDLNLDLTLTYVQNNTVLALGIGLQQQRQLVSVSLRHNYLEFVTLEVLRQFLLSLAKMPLLSQLDLSDNNFFETQGAGRCLAEGLPKITSLNSVSFSYRHVIFPGQQPLDLPETETFRGWGIPQFTAEFSSSLKKWQNITYFSLNNTGFFYQANDSVFEMFAEMPNLVTLNLASTQLADNALPALILQLSKIPSLTQLYLDNNPIGNTENKTISVGVAALLDFINVRPTLTVLSCAYIQFNTVEVTAINKALVNTKVKQFLPLLPNVQSLIGLFIHQDYLGRDWPETSSVVNFSGKLLYPSSDRLEVGVFLLNSYVDIETVILSDVGFFFKKTEEFICSDAFSSIARLLSEKTTVKKIYFSNNFLIAEQLNCLGVFVDGSSFQSVEQLYFENNWVGLSETKNLTVFMQGLSTMPNLNTLSLRGNFIGYLSGNLIRSIAAGLPQLNLEELDLSDNFLGHLSDEDVTSLMYALRSQTRLKRLYLQFNEIGYLGEQSMIELTNSLPYLQSLQIFRFEQNNLSGVSDAVIKKFLHQLSLLPNLKESNVASAFYGLIFSSAEYHEVISTVFRERESLLSQVCQRKTCFLTEPLPDNPELLVTSSASQLSPALSFFKFHWLRSILNHCYHLIEKALCHYSGFRKKNDLFVIADQMLPLSQLQLSVDDSETVSQLTLILPLHTELIGHCDLVQTVCYPDQNRCDYTLMVSQEELSDLRIKGLQQGDAIIVGGGLLAGVEQHYQVSMLQSLQWVETDLSLKNSIITPAYVPVLERQGIFMSSVESAITTQLPSLLAA